MALGCSNDSGSPGVGGSSGSGGNDGGVRMVTSCDQLVAPPGGCGEVCGRDSDCATGLFCRSNMCLADCTASDSCGVGFMCSTRGRCERVTSMGGSGGSGGSGCISETTEPAREVPNVMFLVDRSGSMKRGIDGGQNPGAGNSRWEIAHDAISTVLNELDSIVRFGLATYTWSGGANDPACPTVEVVGFADANAANILMSYTPDIGSAGNTPTGDSIDALVAGIVGSPPPASGPTIIALATDGEPDTCEQPNPDEGQEEAVAAATNAHATTGSNGEPIQTFILSVGSDIGTAHLQEMANVGVGKPRDESAAPADFWVATSPEQLETAFREIVTRNIVCEITLGRRIQNATQACQQGDVTLDGAPLMCPTDWRVTGPDTIELLGAACDQWKTGLATELALEFPCGTLQPG